MTVTITITVSVTVAVTVLERDRRREGGKGSMRRALIEKVFELYWRELLYD